MLLSLENQKRQRNQNLKKSLFQTRLIIEMFSAQHNKY